MLSGAAMIGGSIQRVVLRFGVIDPIAKSMEGFEVGGAEDAGTGEYPTDSGVTVLDAMLGT